MQIDLTVNGKRAAIDAEPRLLLAHALRDYLNLTGTHIGCDTSSCGACTVLLDGVSVKSCTVFAVQASGHEVTTIEGIGNADALHPMQEAFWSAHGLQCGYCTTGMIVSAVDLLQRNADPSDDEIRAGLEGNLCRCTGYENIVKAVRAAGKAMRDGDAAPQRADLMPIHPPRRGAAAQRRRDHPASSSQEAKPLMAFTAMVGARIRRREDPRLITGRATYVDDVRQVGTVVRRIRAQPVRAREDRAHRHVARSKDDPHVLAVYTGDDLHHAHNLKSSLPVAHKMADLKTPPHYVLAVDEVRFVGDPVAVVVATRRIAARDAAEQARRRLRASSPPSSIPRRPPTGPPYVHADPRHERRVHVSRSAPAIPTARSRSGRHDRSSASSTSASRPCRSNRARWWQATTPGCSSSRSTRRRRSRTCCARSSPSCSACRRTRSARSRPKSAAASARSSTSIPRKPSICWVAMQLERPVKYIETRSECFQAMIHGRDQIDDLEIAAQERRDDHRAAAEDLPPTSARTISCSRRSFRR